MHSGERRGAHNGAHMPGRMANWDLVRIFLAVARTGSFRAAAGQLNMSANFLSKRISVLENAYKTPLMTRHVDGIRLTPEGEAVLDAAKRMEEASFGLDRALSRATPGAHRRGPACRHRRARHLLAGAPAGRIPAGLFRTAGRPEMRDAVGGRAAARGRRRRAARGARQSQPEAGQDRPASHHAVRQSVLCRNLRHADRPRRPATKSSHGDSGSQNRPKARRCTTGMPDANSSALSRCATTSPARMSGPSPKAPASAGCRPTSRRSPVP